MPAISAKTLYPIYKAETSLFRKIGRWRFFKEHFGAGSSVEKKYRLLSEAKVREMGDSGVVKVVDELPKNHVETAHVECLAKSAVPSLKITFRREMPPPRRLDRFITNAFLAMAGIEAIMLAAGKIAPNRNGKILAIAMILVQVALSFWMRRNVKRSALVHLEKTEKLCNYAVFNKVDATEKSIRNAEKKIGESIYALGN